MASVTKTAVPGWYWVIAVMALLWEAIGCFMYYGQMTISPEDFAQLPRVQQDIWNATPGWVDAAYAVAVWAGFAGAVGLLLRKTFARPFFLLSLLAVIVQFSWVFTATDILSTMGPSSLALPLLIVAIALLLVWFSGVAQKRGWIA